jgi:hypothetical protein
MSQPLSVLDLTVVNGEVDSEFRSLRSATNLPPWSESGVYVYAGKSKDVRVREHYGNLFEAIATVLRGQAVRVGAEGKKATGTVKKKHGFHAWRIDQRSHKVLKYWNHVEQDVVAAWARSGRANAEAFVVLPEVVGDDALFIRAALHDLEASGTIGLTATGSLTVERGIRSAAPAPARVEEETAPANDEETAATRRRRLAARWLTAAEVSKQLGSVAANAGEAASAARRAGRLLGVWHATEKAYRYPPWQFSPSGQPVEGMSEILALLRDAGIRGGQSRANEGWPETTWFLSPNAFIAEARRDRGETDRQSEITPAAVLQAKPGDVLDAAREEFMEDPDARGG